MRASIPVRPDRLFAAEFPLFYGGPSGSALLYGDWCAVSAVFPLGVFFPDGGFSPFPWSLVSVYPDHDVVLVRSTALCVRTGREGGTL